MKLTNDLLNQIVEEELERLEEKTLPLDFDKYFTTTGKRKNARFGNNNRKSKSFKDIKKDLSIPATSRFSDSTSTDGAIEELVRLLKLASPKNSFDAADIKAAAPGTPQYQTILQIAKNTTDTQLAKSIRDAIKTAHASTTNVAKGAAGTVGTQTMADKPEIPTFTYPRVMNSDASLGAGAFLKSQNTLVQTIFSQSTIAGRISSFSEISKRVWENLDNQKDPRKLLQDVMFVDMINFYLNEQDSRTGGYQFEALCAMLCGGKVVGGGNGVADFVTGDNTAGSSKLYSNYSNITQAAANFKINEPLHYVIGMLRKGAVTEDDDDDKIEKDKRIFSLDLCYVICTLVKTENNVGEFHTSDVDGTLLSIQKLPMKRKVKVDVIKGTSMEQTKVGELKFYGKSTKSFKEKIEIGMKKRSDNAAKALTAMKDFFKELITVEQSTKKYISIEKDGVSDIVNTGDVAIKAYENADKNLVNILNLLSPGSQKVKGDKGQREFNENIKLTKELLDKFVKAVIL